MGIGLLLFVNALVISNVSYSQTLTSEGNSIPVTAFADNWVVTDALGRTLPTYNQVGPVQNDRYIGMFYWLNQGLYRTNPIRDVTQTLLANPTNPNWYFQDYFWDQPENNYYNSQDPWVIQRHLLLLSDAGVDFLFFDMTNGQGFWSGLQPALTQLCQAMQSLHQQGYQTPGIVCFFNVDTQTLVTDAYNGIYQPGLYKDCWFYWQGKPLVMANPVSVTDPNQLNFFTFRNSWAFNPTTQDDWNFLDTYPQHYSWHTNSNTPEQMSVSKSQGAPLVYNGNTDNKGSSASSQNNGPNPEPSVNQYWVCPQSDASFTGQGFSFEEQWSRIGQLPQPPQIITVTGWNEWTAGMWNADSGMAGNYTFMGQELQLNGWYSVDEFNDEFNRDIEPVNGTTLGGNPGNDNFYYQLINHIRQYKGMKAPAPASPPQSISMGLFTDWTNVAPVYSHMPGSVMHRNFVGADNTTNYTNNTGRNDIIQSRTTFDSNYVYFFAQTASNLTSPTGPNWMLFFIDADQNHSTGWEGYDYALNMQVTSATQTSLSKWNGSSWQVVDSNIAMAISGNQLEIRVPRAEMGQANDPVAFDFHIVDNVQALNTVADFFVNGCSAPDRRFNYRYTATGTAFTPTPTPTPSSVWRINAGGPQYVSPSSGLTWAADQDYSGTTTADTVTNTITNTADPALYQSERWGNPITYTFPVPAGNYQVTLKFAEFYFNAAGDRVFNVSINGNQVLTNFDIFTDAGGENVADDKVFNNIQPSNGQIVIQLGPASVNNAKISAIQIIPQPPTPTATYTNSPTKTVTNTVTPTATLTSTLTPTRTFTCTPTSTYTASPTATATASLTWTNTSTFTLVITATKTSTETTTNTPSSTMTTTSTSTASMTCTVTKTATKTYTSTPTSTPTTTFTSTSSFTFTFTASGTPTRSSTVTYTSTSSDTPSVTNTDSTTPTSSSTRTPSATLTATASPSPTSTASRTPISTATLTCTLTATSTVTLSSTVTATEGVVLSAPVPYPNPVMGPGPVQVWVVLQQPAGWLTIKVYTLSFRMVSEEKFRDVPAGPDDFPLPLADKWGRELANGLYYIQVTTPQGHSMGKWLILR
jgi:hypothetical protein